MLSSKAPRFAGSSFWRKQRRSWSRGAWFSEVRRMSNVDQLGDGQALSTNWKKPVVRWGWCFQHCVCLVRLHVCTQMVCEPASPHGYMCSRVWVCAHGYACVCLHECVCFCVSLCMGLCVHVVGACSMCVCVCVCVCVCTHTYWSASAGLSQLWAPPAAGRARQRPGGEHPLGPHPPSSPPTELLRPHLLPDTGSK